MGSEQHGIEIFSGSVAATLGDMQPDLADRGHSVCAAPCHALVWRVDTRRAEHCASDVVASWVDACSIFYSHHLFPTLYFRTPDGATSSNFPRLGFGLGA